MTTTTQGADTARETGMRTTTQTQMKVEWTESQIGTTRHGLAQIGDVEARTVESRPGAPYWSVEARARPDGIPGPEVVVRVSDTEWTLDEARAAAVERATWAAAALARALSPDAVREAVERAVGVCLGRAVKHANAGRADAEQEARQCADEITRALLGEPEPELRDCADCGESTAADDLTTDGRCEACVAACTCTQCGGDSEPDDDGEPTLCGECVEAQAEADDGECSTCAGTGIGQSGDPDTSRCHDCGGGGARRYRMDPADAADAAYDRAREGDW